MMASDPILTRRLRLRRFARDLSDLDALHAIQSDPEHMRFYPHPFSREESRAWIERHLEREARDGYSLWAIEDRKTGEFLGNCGPVLQGVDGVDEVELGWSVTPLRARQGIATEAAIAWRDHCLGPLGLGHVISLVRPENAPSRGVAEKIGMSVWKETIHGSQGWLHLVYRVDAFSSEPSTSIPSTIAHRGVPRCDLDHPGQGRGMTTTSEPPSPPPDRTPHTDAAQGSEPQGGHKRSPERRGARP